MTEPDKPARRRKPLRRTAWGLLIGGLLTLGLMVGVVLLIHANGKDIGPGRTAVLPAGERASVHKHLGPKPVEERASSPACELTGPDGRVRPSDIDWFDTIRSSTDVTVRCEEEAIFLTGAASAIASEIQSPVSLIPVAMMLAGLLLFFPRFTMVWARLGNPLGGLVDRLINRKR